MDLKKIEEGMRQILHGIGTEHLNDEVLSNTPRRVALMYSEFFADIKQEPTQIIKTFYQENYDEMVAVKGIPFFSICEHHFLPFTGTADIVYIVKEGRVVGASKLARALDIAAKRPQLQERLTTQVADALMTQIKPYGVLVRVEATHLCVTLRGVKKPESKLVTSAIRGLLRTNPASRAEAFTLIS